MESVTHVCVYAVLVPLSALYATPPMLPGAPPKAGVTGLTRFLSLSLSLSLTHSTRFTRDSTGPKANAAGVTAVAAAS